MVSFPPLGLPGAGERGPGGAVEVFGGRGRGRGRGAVGDAAAAGAGAGGRGGGGGGVGSEAQRKQIDALEGLS